MIKLSAINAERCMSRIISSLFYCIHFWELFAIEIFSVNFELFDLYFIVQAVYNVELLPGFLDVKLHLQII